MDGGFRLSWCIYFTDILAQTVGERYLIFSEAGSSLYCWNWWLRSSCLASSLELAPPLPPRLPLRLAGCLCSKQGWRSPVRGLPGGVVLTGWCWWGWWCGPGGFAHQHNQWWPSSNYEASRETSPCAWNRKRLLIKQNQYKKNYSKSN